MPTYLAADIGASNGRLILGSVNGRRIELEEIYRFENIPVDRNGHLCWDLEGIYRHILQGLGRCKEKGKTPVSMGIDTWAVDFVLLDRHGALLGDSVAYRDRRADGMDEIVEKQIDPGELYKKTGIQKQPFNTIYQLEAVKRENPESLEQAEHLLMVPEYLNYRLTGVCKNEYTNATSTGLVNARTRAWDADLLRTLEYPEKLFGPLCPPGTGVGGFSEEAKAAAGFDCTVVLPATHDTGSAFLAVPSGEDGSVIISSGTWSLVGVENSRPITTRQSREFNFTNEGGYLSRYRYLKNIMGLWMIQSVRRELHNALSFEELAQAAVRAEGFPSTVDANAPGFLAPGSMTEAVKDFCRGTGQRVPETVGELMQCIYRSLALSYAEAIRQLQELTGKSYSRIHIVGGGSRDAYLNQLTAGATGLPVYAGPTEATAIGNLLVQMIRGGEFGDLQEARAAVRDSFDISVTQP